MFDFDSTSTVSWYTCQSVSNVFDNLFGLMITKLSNISGLDKRLVCTLNLDCQNFLFDSIYTDDWIISAVLLWYDV